MTAFTNKNLDFLPNEKLIKLLRSVLDEIDVVASIGAYRSATYLAVSAIEGLFRELIELREIPLGALGWPANKKTGTYTPLKDLDLFEMELILHEDNALPENFEKFYSPLRKFRNYMHPKLELRDEIPIAQSIGLLAIACLDALIETYGPLRFIAGQRWDLVHGLAQVPEDDTIHMPHAGDHVSLLVSEKEAKDFKEMTFRVIISPGTIFNFVYNYFSPDNFMAARIEGRSAYGRSGENGRLVCTKWRTWFIRGQYIVSTEPDPKRSEHTIRVVLASSGAFSIIADQQPLQLASDANWDFNPAGKVGFMTELGLVSVLDLKVQS
jgi:hypothetical protein